MEDEEWNTAFVRTLGVMLSGDTIDVRDFYGRPIQDDTFLMLLNAHHETVNFVLPGQEEVRWELIIDTVSGGGLSGNQRASPPPRNTRWEIALFRYCV
jgi:glycogen operon protein